MAQHLVANADGRLEGLSAVLFSSGRLSLLQEESLLVLLEEIPTPIQKYIQ